MDADLRSAPDRNRINARSRAATAAATTIPRDPATVLDPNEIAEVEALVEFVGICRYFAGELAINEMSQRALTELRQYLDDGTQALLDGLRHAGESERAFRQSQVDAAVRFCSKYSGANMPLCWGKLHRSPQPQSPRLPAPETGRFSSHAPYR